MHVLLLFFSELSCYEWVGLESVDPSTVNPCTCSKEKSMRFITKFRLDPEFRLANNGIFWIGCRHWMQHIAPWQMLLVRSKKEDALSLDFFSFYSGLGIWFNKHSFSFCFQILWVAAALCLVEPQSQRPHQGQQAFQMVGNGERRLVAIVRGCTRQRVPEKELPFENYLWHRERPSA